MQVTPVAASMNSSVNLGAYNIEGILAEIYSEPEVVTHDAADITNPRKDIVAIQRDLSVGVRACDIVIVKGTPAASPVAPSLTKNDSTLWQDGLYEVTIPAGETDASNFTYTDIRQASQSLVTTPAIYVPTGAVLEWYTHTCPDGYIWAEGQAVSRTEHSDLFDLWGTTFGAGDGSTTFNVIDKRGLAGVGYESGSEEFGTLGGTYGEKKHVLTEGELAAHAHDNSHAHNNSGEHSHTGYTASGTGGGGLDVFIYNVGGGTIPNTSVGGAHNHSHSGNTGSKGSNVPHNNIQPSISARYIIKT
jgi:microcystin-dependent protein